MQSLQMMRNSYRDNNNNSQSRKADKVNLINSIYNKDYGRKTSNTKLPKKQSEKKLTLQPNNNANNHINI